jgi:alpha-beta hydrolase superfamily lysophospholipase
MTLTETPAGTAATAVTPSEATARMADGTLLRTLHWTPAGDPWAVALIVHGLGEHGGRYGNVAAALTAAGIDVNAYDQRGCGGSAGPRAYVDHWGRFHDDLQERLASLRAAYPGLPLIMYGHSLGGLMACGYVLAEPPRPLPDLLVLSAPAIEADIPGWKRALAGLLTKVTPRMRLSNGPVSDGLSRDPSIREAYLRDPLCQTSSTVRLGAEAFAEQTRLHAAIAAVDRLPVPTYVLHGSEDPIVPVASSVVLGSKGNVTRVVQAGLRHECHNEPEHAQVMAGVVAWLQAQRGTVAESVPGGAAAPSV